MWAGPGVLRLMVAEGLGREQGQTGLPLRRQRPAEPPAQARKNEGRNEGANVLRHVGVYTNARHNSSARLWLYRR